MLKYIVKDVACDYGIFLVDENGNGEMIDICNSRANALKVCEILNADKEHIVWKEKQLVAYRDRRRSTSKVKGDTRC